MDSLKGKVALVTGSATGIGRGIALKLAEYGANLSLVDRNDVELKTTADECRRNVEVLHVVADLGVDDSLQDALDDTIAKFGRIDVLVNSIGIRRTGTIENQTMPDFDDMFHVDVRSVFLLSQKAIPHLAKTKGLRTLKNGGRVTAHAYGHKTALVYSGSIVTISSISTQQISMGSIAYLMAKGSIDIFTKAAALELASKGIRVNAVLPGTVETNILINDGWTPRDSAQYFAGCGQHFPIGRIGRVDEIAECVCFLASDAASFITGELFRVDGGFAAGVAWDQEK